jgi:GrpB-like predicted nucleotidyltransferase (UPF0157 family)
MASWPVNGSGLTRSGDFETTMSIEIHPYDLDWPDLFRQTAQPLRDALGAFALRIDHIGSTSIPGTAAKPIIDIQISVPSFEPFELIHSPLVTLGYVWRSDNPDLTKRYFREMSGTRRTHVHIRRSGSWAEQFALLFRDYMRCHPEDVQQYVELKHQLAQQFQNDREGYTEAKTPFIWQVMRKADQWCQSTDWQTELPDL